MEAGIAVSSHYLAAKVDRFEPVLLKCGVFIIAAMVAVEGFGITAPGQTLLIVVAIMSVLDNTSIYSKMLAAWFAAVSGSTIVYAIGRIGGRSLSHRLPVIAKRLDRMERFSRRYGGLFIVVSRFFDGSRQFGSIIVGSLNMPFLQFLAMSALGAVPWVGLWGLGIYYLDKNIHAIAAYFGRLSPYTWIITGVLVVSMLLYLLAGRNLRWRDHSK